MVARPARLNKSALVRKLVELPSDDARWFEEHYPNGSFSWLLSGLLHEFRLTHKATPKDYMTIAAAELKKIAEEK